MRSRPKVKLLLCPGVIAPGERLEAEVVLTARSATPVDFVSMCLRATTKIGGGEPPASARRAARRRTVPLSSGFYWASARSV